jgi:hypothetical protein
MAVAKQIREALAPTQAQKDAAASGIPGGNPLGYERAKEGQKADVAQFSKLYEGISSTGDIAGSGLENLRLSRSLLNEPTFVSGFGTDIVQGYRKAIAQLSPGHENDAQPQETFRKVMAGSILQQINTLKAEGQAAGLTNSRFFQSQVMLMEKAAQNPSNSVAANRTLTEIAWRHSQLSIQIANMADQYKQTHGGLLDSGFSQLLRQKLSSTSIFTPAELAQPKLLAAVTMPALTEEQVPAWARAMKIQPGQPVRTQSGRYVVPIEVSRTKSGPLAAPAGAQY